ncbi:M36 family metallopeptidase [Dactylosporangium sp. NPDC051541]|uniref:M36 family metallopeptidase n=1 Tax=Dactylosporangium sp. NPDC051541 TaxID=3363977 RepID=UPI0037B5AE71
MYRRVVGVLASVAGGVMVVAGSGTAAQAAPAVPNDLRQVQVRQSLLGSHTWYQQLYHGLPVLGGFYATHTDSASGAVTVQDGRLDVRGLTTETPGVAADHARASVAGRHGGQAGRSELVVVPGAAAKLAWLVVTRTGHGSVQTVVDAGSGATLKEQNLVKEATGTGTVFDPNPVVATQNESLTDRDDADYPGLRRAYRRVALTHLDGRGTTLQGAYANNISTDPVRSARGDFSFNRSQPGFEQVMGYHGITSAQEYIHGLGFRDVNNEPQDYATTGFTDDNSFYDPDTDGITFGTGGVDDAEDIEVIWHEYGHAIQDDQVPGFGNSEVELEAGSIGEGFGDYWAFTMSQANSPDTARTPLACIADWDSTSYTDDVPHCLRRTDGTKMYPADLEGEVHADGEIWSRALFDINHALGRTKANRVILEAQFGFDPNTTMPAAARETVRTARALYGQQAANQVRAAFHARGIL